MSIKRLKDLPDGSGSLSNDDIFIFMDDPAGSALTKKISLSTLSSDLPYDNTASNLSATNVKAALDELASDITYSIPSNTGLVPNSTSISNIVNISQTNYDAIVTKNSSTLYVIS
jgi:hypothetical protein